ncbi:MAG: HAMP domain-containing sensor histidine kinase [Spirochaetales bacterium]|nr:HAMP domain-containing sensor histidine kinase [Spirochaetales bacterium]
MEYDELKTQFEQSDENFLDLLREKNRKTGFLFYIAEMEDDYLRQIYITEIPFIPPADNNPPGHGFPMDAILPKENIYYLTDKTDSLTRGEVVYNKIQREHKDKMEFDLVFAAILDNQNLLIIVRPVEQLSEHTAISNQFLLIIGLITLLISIAIAYRSAKSVVRPVKEITEISEHIANLDFSHRYTGRDRDEIGILGDSMNRISTQLDSAIVKLQDEMSLQKRFFAGVSHEFKTPVGLIRGYAESLRLGLANNQNEINEYSDIIIEETDRLNHLVSDIIFLVKSGSAEFQLSRKNVDIISLLCDSIEKIQPALSDKSIRLEKELPPDAVLQGDGIRIKQIFDNILNNAIRHTPEGKHIIVTVRADEDGIIVSVENEGEPIPDEHLSHLFDPFYTLYESRSKVSSGTGLGLSIVKNLVEKHGGYCGIENLRHNDFQGVRVWFQLPFLK